MQSVMHCRRSGWLKRLILLALVILLTLKFCLRLNLCFLPDEAVDSQLRNHIRSSFQLPSRAQSAPSDATVRRVHFMHKTHAILPDYKPFISSWRRVYPNYELYFWTDADIDRLVGSRYAKLEKFYRYQLSSALERSDFARILILHAFGGWYADLDAGCLNSAENLTKSHSLIIPLEPYIHAMVSFNRRRLVNNAVMYSSVGHPYWMFYIHRMASDAARWKIARTKDDAVFTTGPVMLTRAMEQFLAANSDRCDDSRVEDFWCPYLPGPEKFSPLIDNSSIWLASWGKVMCWTVLGWESGLSRECSRLSSQGFANRLPPDAYTYHAFLHLTGNKRLATTGCNVTKWGLDIRLSPMAHLT